MQIITAAEQRDAKLAHDLQREATNLEAERVHQFEEMNRRAAIEAEKASTPRERKP